jgi:transposase
VLTMEGAVEVRVLARQGKKIREIARDLGLSRNTVRRYLRSGDPPAYCRTKARRSKLDPHREYIVRRLTEASPDRLAATVLLRELRERGYSGGVSILKDFMAQVRPAAAVDPVVRFETRPGEQMQVDWATIRRGADRMSVFIATLGWSRAAYVEFVTDERLETWLACHERAFAYFGGVPRTVLYDNLRSVVLDRDFYAPGSHRFNPAFLDLSRHYGFTIRLCRPYRARTKGKVERFVRYLRQSMWLPLVSRWRAEGLMVDVDAANMAARRWLREVANTRLHATTGEAPVERLVEERRHLQILPPPWRGAVRPARPQRDARPVAGPSMPVALQHSLTVYEGLFDGGQV